jgi:hypothetical protein
LAKWQVEEMTYPHEKQLKAYQLKRERWERRGGRRNIKEEI